MKILLFANTDWYLYNFRRSLALALKAEGHEVVLVSPAGKYGPALRELGFRWIPAPMRRRSLNPLREIALVLWLRRLIAAERVDLLHAFTIKCAVYGSLAAQLARVPARVNAVAGMGYVYISDELKARVLRPVVTCLMRIALDGNGARLILQNADDRALFENEGLVHPSRIRVIPGSGVDCQRFTPQRKSSVTTRAQRFRVLLPARILWDKGISEYVDASRLLRARGYDIEFLIAGAPDAGNPAAVPESKLESWTAEGLVRCLGHVEDMPSLFGDVDAVVLPSYREGLPKGLIEGAACGLPLITTDVPGCRDVVQHGETGLLIPPRDSLALADAIARLYDEPELRSTLGAAARLRAVSQFDEQIIIRKTADVYHEIASAFVPLTAQ